MASNPQGVASGGAGGGGGGGGFDMNKLLKPTSTPMNLIPNSTNLTTSPSFPTPSSPASYLTPSSSYPPPTGPYPPYHYYPYPPPPPPHQHFALQPNINNNNRPHQTQISYPPQPLPQQPNPNSSASTPLPLPPSPTTTSTNNLLMAFFGNQNQTHNLSPALSDSSTVAVPSAPPVRLRSSKLPKGRHLIGSHLTYDIDVRLDGEVQPQLEVTPITKYASDPGLVLGRQIAVNRNYICYGLKQGNIRILNIITALRSLLRGHTQRVTDMAFFAEDVHLLASASVDGRFFIWNITEGPDEEEKPQILGKIVVAVQILADGESLHPRVCWHPHKQEILMVAIGNRILRIDSNRVGKGERFSGEEPLKCPIDELINGVHFVGKHDGEVSELSMCQWLTTRLASASIDGTVKIWDDRKGTPLAVLRPYDGQPVNSVTFLIGPYPQHIVLITGGPLNREVKIWASAEEEGWLLPSDVESWRCIQTLDLKSSAESRLEDAFFNQVVALNRAGLFLLANAKKNAIYAVHIDYGTNPASTRMDYIAEFTVTMPILSLTGTSDGSTDAEHIVQVYCVQTQAIQQYALDLSQCLPPPFENAELEKTDPSAARDATNSNGSAILESSHGNKSADLPMATTTLVPPILSSGSDSVPIASRSESFPSSEVTGLPEKASSAETKPSALPSHSNAENIHTASPPPPLSPRLSCKSSGLRSPSNSYEPCPPPNELGGDQSVTDYSVEHRANAGKEKVADVPSSGDNMWKGDRNVAQNDISMGPDPPVVFKHPTHLVTPSEILSTVVSSSENSKFSQRMNVRESKVQDVVNNDTEGVEVEVKVVGETGNGQNNEYNSPRESHISVNEKKEKSFYSQASDLSIQMARDCCVGTYNVDGIRQVNDVSVTEALDRPSNSREVEEQDVPKDAPAKVGTSEPPMVIPQSPVPATKGKKQKGKNTQISGASSASPSPYNSTDSSNEPACNSVGPSSDATLCQLSAMQNMLDQLINMQKEMQKQMNTVVSGPVTKEGKRLESSLGRSIEKIVKANTDALWARFQEENAKHEKLERDRMQQITNLITNSINKDLPAVFEKTLKKEIAGVGPAVTRTISPTLEKSITSAITETFQKGVGEKAVSQLEKSVSSKLETTVARQIQAQFQTSGKQALQDALRSSLESSIVPAFEMSCKAMFEQIDSTFQKGLVKHTTTVQQQFESAHSPLAIALRDAINSATSVTQTLSGELADGQRKLLALAAAGANSKAVNPLVEAPLDPTKELSRLIAERKYEEAFTGALHRSDVSIVSWLCSQVDLPGILSTVPLPLSQGVLLALLQQLACDISKETPRKLAWMTDVAVAINPADPMIAMHVRPIFEQVYQILGHQRNLPTTSASEANSIRLLMHVINSVLMSYK
ncbi:enhancer of mRNA-decapping protein 4-like isoform X2 [Mangifera indica]|uniref:enhancer of mRNA-decapping protein 4-like isoform X2 n=1 Tax=Mangifera indica TaxID=29780 RepID=UPI001CF9899A|nr:enhancer of mRNA-decapping protein 4-like isoform X2 [Mangifera indica]